MRETNSVSEKEAIKENVTSLLREEKDILFAYLYGSFVCSDETPESDVDIGIYLADANVDAYSCMPERLMIKLEEAVGREVDVRVLNGRNVVFLHQVLKKGELLFSRDEQKRVEFETTLYDRYLDFKYYLDQYNKMRRKRMLA